MRLTPLAIAVACATCLTGIALATASAPSTAPSVSSQQQQFANANKAEQAAQNGQNIKDIQFYNQLDPNIPQVARTPNNESRKKELDSIFHFFKTTQLSGSVSMDGSFSNPGYKYTKGDSSSLRIGQAEIDISREFNSWLKAKLALYYADSPVPALQSDSDNKIDVDQLYVTIGDLKKSPFYGIVGKDYLPFGVFRHHTLTNTITKTLSEMKETTLLVGFETNQAYGSAYVYNSGGSNTTGNIVNPKLNNYGFELGRAQHNKNYYYNVSLGFISSYLENQAIYALASSNTSAHPAAWTAHAEFMYKHYGVSADFVSGLSKFDTDAISFNGERAEPKGYTTEAFYRFKYKNMPSQFSVGVQRSYQSLALSIPRIRYMAQVWMEFTKHLSGELEYQHNIDYSDHTTATYGRNSTAVNGTGKTADAVFARVTLSF
jgi:hypothetical protein